MRGPGMAVQTKATKTRSKRHQRRSGPVAKAPRRTLWQLLALLSPEKCETRMGADFQCMQQQAEGQ